MTSKDFLILWAEAEAAEELKAENAELRQKFDNAVKTGNDISHRYYLENQELRQRIEKAITQPKYNTDVTMNIGYKYANNCVIAILEGTAKPEGK